MPFHDLFPIDPVLDLAPELMDTVEALEPDVEQLHRSSALYYHVYWHPRGQVVPVLGHLGRLASKHGVELDMVPLIGAGLTHDIGFHLPLRGAYASKEERSADMADVLFEKHGWAQDDRATAGGIILSTHPDEPADTPEKVAMNIADLYTVPYPRTRSLAESVKLFLEGNALRQEADEARLGWTEFLENQQALLRKYFRKNLSLGSFDQNGDGTPEFVVQSQPNINYLTMPLVKKAQLFIYHHGERMLPFLGPEIMAEFEYQVLAA